ncbi:MAG: ABC transporter substrate-binding protein [Clostridiales bacterium]|jgi:peptide/nickel transport system substrate-binding protein|nr:ABC transporter substrate-binding protein [Clostridiales bacterium]
MSKTKKNIVLLLLACLLMSVLSGCAPSSSEQSDVGPSEEPQETAYQKTIVIAPALDFVSTETQVTTSGTSKSVFLMVFNTLVEQDTEKGGLIPSLAESWELVSDDTWEFKLRRGVKFHDGTDFTAEDVKFTIERGKEQGASKAKLESIKRVEIVDDYTVHIIMSKPDVDILYKLTDPNCVILSKNAFETLSEEEAYKIGTGPYTYNRWEQGDYLSLLRFEDYWEGTPKTEEIVIRNIPEAASRLIALQTGEIDICISPPQIDLHYIAEDPNLTLLQIPGANCRYIGINSSKKPFNDIRVRQAIAHSINRKGFVEAVYEGNATVHNNVMHPGNLFYKEIEGYSYDKEKALALLAEAGYPNGFSATIYSSSGTVQKAVATVMQAQMAEIGIDLEVQSLETATFNATVAPGSDYDMCVNGWGGYVVGPDNALRNMFYTGGNNNNFGFSDEYVDKTLDEAVSISDIETRKKLYGELQEYITNQAVFLPIAIEMIDMGVKSDLEGFVPPQGSIQKFKNVYIPIE